MSTTSSQQAAGGGHPCTAANVVRVADQVRGVADGIESGGLGSGLCPLVAPLLHEGDRQPGRLAMWYTLAVRDGWSPELRHCLRQTLDRLGRVYSHCAGLSRSPAMRPLQETEEQIITRLRAAADLLVKMLVTEPPKRGRGRPKGSTDADAEWEADLADRWYALRDAGSVRDYEDGAREIGTLRGKTVTAEAIRRAVDNTRKRRKKTRQAR